MDGKVASYNLGNVSDVFNNLSDDLSREIFSWRLRYLLDGNDDLLRENIVSMLKRTVVQLPMLNGRKIVFYGLGNRAKGLTPDVYGAIEKLNNCKAVAFVDKFALHPPLGGCDSLNGLKIISHAKLLSEYSDAIVVTSTPMYRVEIIDSLIADGFPKKQISPFDDAELLFGKPYFDEEIIRHNNNEIFVDCGVYDGITIRDFSNYTKFQKVIGFEPDVTRFNIIKHNLENWSIANVEIVPKGAWSCETTLSFISNIGQTSRLEENDATLRDTYKENISSKENICRAGKIINIPLTTIDSVCLDEKVTLIKMDIEGSELEALKGAANTIIRNKPRMAISIYHKPEDIIEIPQYINSLIPDYKFYIRQYLYNNCETVLYAIV